MPGKEAVVEVEKAVVPEPVTKEIPKCEAAAVDVNAKKHEEPEPVKTSDSTPVADSKPQDTEITSSAEQKTDKEDTASVKSTNGSAVQPKEKAEASDVVEESSGNGEKPNESPVESKTDASAELKNSEAEPKADPEVDAKSSEAEAASSEPKSSETVEPKSSETVEPKPSEAVEPKPSEVVEPKPSEAVEPKPSEAVEPKPSEAVETKPSEAVEPKSDSTGAAKSAEAKQDEAEVSETKPSETTPPVETMEVDSKSSEAAAKPVPAEDEKIVVEKDAESKPADPVVTGSDEVKKPQDASETKETPSVGSSTEPKPESLADEKAASSSTAEVTHDLEKQISELKKQGLALYVKKDYCAAADSFGKLLEVQAPLYGEMSEKLAETYFLYGSAMYEYGKTENEVLGDKVKEKDEEDEEDEGDEEMEVDDKEAEPAAESAEKRPVTPSGYGEEEGEKEPADVTIGGEDKEEDDDSFRVAWEMLELAKATFRKGDNKKRLADTLMKLGEVGVEIENVEAMAEMEEGLKIRKEVYPENHRIIPETHFHIGMVYAAFDKYDDAVQHFTSAKECLEKRIEVLSGSDTKEDKAEVEEMKSLLPEIQEKIEDTVASKADKEKIKEKLSDEILNKAEQAAPAFTATSGDKPVSNISHLVKRKRKVDDILPERAAKQIRQEGEEEAKTGESDSKTPTEGENKDEKPEEKPVESTEQKEEPKEKPEEEKNGVASEDKPKTEDKTAKPEEAKPAEKKPEVEKMEE